jgi:hypothetical protein
MQVSSVQNANAPLLRSASRSTEAKTSISPAQVQGAKADKKVATAAPDRPELPAWKAERNAARELHKSGSTEHWLAARTSWMDARDASHASRWAQVAPAPIVSSVQAEVLPAPIAASAPAPTSTQP